MTPFDQPRWDEFDVSDPSGDDQTPSEEESHVDAESGADEPVFNDEVPVEDETQSKGVSPLVIAQVFLGVVFVFLALVFLGIVILRLFAPHSPEGMGYGYLDSLALFAVFGTLGFLLLRSGFRRRKKH